MATSYATDHLATANKAYVANFGNKVREESSLVDFKNECGDLTIELTLTFLLFAQGSLPLPPGKHVAIVGCMDARL